MSSNIQYYEQMLKNNICEIIVNTATGEQTVNCTLQESLTPKPGQPISTHISDLLTVYDVVKKTWFGFLVNQIKSFKLLTGSLADVNPIISRPAQSQYASVRPGYTDKKSEYTAKLTAGVCYIKFTKADGSIREMNATLEPKTIAALNLTPKTSNTTSDDTILKVVDVDLLDWRTIKVDKILEFNSTPNAVVVTATQGANNTNRDTYIAMLQAGPCVVTFTKADMSERVMNVSLQADVIASLGLTPTGKTSKAVNLDIISVIDLDAKMWKSFRVDSVISLVPATPIKRRTTLNP